MYTYGGSPCQDKLTDVVLSFYDTESKSIECGFLDNDPLMMYRTVLQIKNTKYIFAQVLTPFNTAQVTHQ